MLRTLSGQPSLRSMAHRPSRPTVSKALVRCTKRMYRLWFCLRNFSLICRTANIMSTVPLFLLKAQWLSEMTSSKKWCVIQFSMISISCMAYWSIWDGLLRSWLRILYQRWTISDFPVNRAPSEDGTGTMALEEGPHTVFKPSNNLLKLCLSEYCPSSAALCCHHLFFIWVQEQVFNQVDVIDNHEVSLCLA